jgi:hypothetical protein
MLRIHTIESLVKYNAGDLPVPGNLLMRGEGQAFLLRARDLNPFSTPTQVSLSYLFRRLDSLLFRIFNACRAEKIPPLIRRKFHSDARKFPYTFFLSH